MGQGAGLRDFKIFGPPYSSGTAKAREFKFYVHREASGPNGKYAN